MSPGTCGAQEPGGTLAPRTRATGRRILGLGPDEDRSHQKGGYEGNRKERAFHWFFNSLSGISAVNDYDCLQRAEVESGT